MILDTAPYRGTSLRTCWRTCRRRCLPAGCSAACAEQSGSAWGRFAGSRAACATRRGFAAAPAALQKGRRGRSGAVYARQAGCLSPPAAAGCPPWPTSLGPSRSRRAETPRSAAAVGRRRTVGRAVWGAVGPILTRIPPRKVCCPLFWTPFMPIPLQYTQQHRVVAREREIGEYCLSGARLGVSLARAENAQ